MSYAFGHITSIPNALNSLFALYQTAYPTDPSNEPVYFWFGATLSAWFAPTTIEVNGVNPANQEPATLGPDFQREETFSIECKISMFPGFSPTTANYFTTMQNVWNAWIALEIAVANNPTLSTSALPGGTVRYAEFGEMAYEPSTDGKGMCMGVLTWVVRCSARNYSLA